jgi:hypothetical protein
MKSLRVYVAGPYTGDPECNVKRAICVGDQIWQLGHVPFVPHTSHLWDQLSSEERSWDDWITWCLTWVGQCDVVFRMAGTSRGADVEAQHAALLEIPVVHSLEELAALAETAPTRASEPA